MRVNTRELEVNFIRTAKMLADILTKPLSGELLSIQENKEVQLMC